MLLFACASLSLLAYTYVLYPCLIYCLSRTWPLSVTPRESYVPTVSVCVAAHNAAAHLPAKLDSLLAQSYPKDKLEILVYSDGSTDDTEAIASAYAARDLRVRLLWGTPRQGKPTALNRLREAALGEVLIMTDARQPISSAATRHLVSWLADPSVGCVSGMLVLAGHFGAGTYWRYEAFLRSCEGRFRGLVGVTGALYAVRRADIDPLPHDTLLDDMWIPWRLRCRGRRILLCEAAQAFDDALPDEREFLRKVRTLAGNFQLVWRMPRVCVPFLNPQFFELFSHKLLRLVCPLALIVLGLASCVGSVLSDRHRDAYVVLLFLQALSYGLAALGSSGGRVAACARTFVVLHAAVLVGLWQALRGRQRVLW